MPDLIKHLRRYGQLTLRDMSSLVLEISALLSNLPVIFRNLAEPPAPDFASFGGWRYPRVHRSSSRQFYDLVNLLDRYGSP